MTARLGKRKASTQEADDFDRLGAKRGKAARAAKPTCVVDTRERGGAKGGVPNQRVDAHETLVHAVGNSVDDHKLIAANVCTPGALQAKENSETGRALKLLRDSGLNETW